jgi:DNA-binding transcriptional ArsR family regulator
MESGAEDEKFPATDQRLVGALTHPQRARIFAELNKHMMGPREFSQAFGTGLLQVSYHFKVLERMGGLGIVGRLGPDEDSKPAEGN